MYTQKNRLNETVLLSTGSKTCLNWSVRNPSQFYAHKFCLSRPMINLFSGNINQTLMALRNCLEMLRENQKSGGNKVKYYLQF